MARGLPKDIAEFMAKYKIDFDEIWEVRAGAFAIKHKALERVALEQNIRFATPVMLQIDMEKKIAAMCVIATMGERSEWTTGEAAPANCKNAYPLAMAEKRGKDRVTLKLLQAHGDLYSEDEAEDFKRPNPHVTRPADIVPDVEYDQNGQPIDNIPTGEPGIERLPKAKARQDFEAAQKELRSTVTIKQLEDWGARNANRVETFPPDWAAILRGIYIEHRDELRGAKAA